MTTYFHKCTDPLIRITDDARAYTRPQAKSVWGGGAIFLDRDGTIIVEKNYLREIEDLKLLPGAVPGLKKLGATGMPLYLLTNQAGIAHGYFDENRVDAIHRYLIDLLATAGIHFRGVLYCPHHPQAEVAAYRTDCFCRKPKPGLLLHAAYLDSIDLSRSFVIGDKLTDLEAAKNVTAKAILVLTGYGVGESRRIQDREAPDYVADDLLDAAEWINTNPQIRQPLERKERLP